MNRIKYIQAIVICFLLMLGSGCTEENMKYTENNTGITETTAKYLRCEYRINSLGIDIAKRRLSWILESEQRSQVQSAYQILAAGSDENLKRDKGDLWNSGKVESDQSNQVVYKGKMLDSRRRCYWKVRVWDKDGKVSAWSEPAVCTVGLLEQEDWQAKWIGYDAESLDTYKEKEKSDALNLEGCKWI